MNVLYIIILAMLGFVALAMLWFVSGYNSLVRLKALLDEAFSGIDVQLKRRFSLIPNLVETVKGYATHEKGVFENVAKMRSAVSGAQDMGQKLEAEAGLTQALGRLFAVAENYPELKANQNFLELQKELSVIEHDIQLARRYYNGTARQYNTAVRTFPTNIIANYSNFQVVPYFEVADNQERETPTVKF